MTVVQFEKEDCFSWVQWGSRIYPENVFTSKVYSPNILSMGVYWDKPKFAAWQ